MGFAAATVAAITSIFLLVAVATTLAATLTAAVQAGHFFPEERRPNRVEPKYRFLWFFGSVLVFACGNFGGRSRLWF